MQSSCLLSAVTTSCATAESVTLTTDSPDVTTSSTGSTTVQLYIEPAGPVLLGDTVNVVCRVTDRHALDIVRLVRRPLTAPPEGMRGDVITTNGVLEGHFKVARSRYKVVGWDEIQSVVQLQITGATKYRLCYSHSTNIEIHSVKIHFTARLLYSMKPCNC